MMVYSIFHTAIIINRKNWRTTIKLHFENLRIFFFKSERTHMLRPPLPLFAFVRFSMTPSLPSSTNVLLEWPPSWVRNFFSGVFRGSKIFTRGYFVGLNFFLVGLSWVQSFFSWVFRGSKILWFSINFSKKRKETYDWRILTKSFK